MHKLFQLCDDTAAMAELGFEAPEKLWTEFAALVRGRIGRQRRMAKLVAEDRADCATGNAWWMTESR